jgi:hypothetical protein
MMPASHLRNENEHMIFNLRFNKSGLDTLSPSANKLGPVESSHYLKKKCGADKSRPRRVGNYPWGY